HAARAVGAGRAAQSRSRRLAPQLPRPAHAEPREMTPGPVKATLFAALLAAPALLAPAAALAAADPGIPALTVQTAPGGGQTYTLTLQVLALMTALTLLPAILLMMTAFTRIVIVLGILRQALGAGQTPPNQVLLGLALFLTFFVMSPVIDKINTDAFKPYSAGTIDATVALDRSMVPLKKFMLDQT